MVSSYFFEYNTAEYNEIYENTMSFLNEALIEAGKRLDQKFLTCGNEGNISHRGHNNTIIITASGTTNHSLTENDFITTDLQGTIISGQGKPSSEVEMHLAIYQERSDINAVVHAHPPYVVALSLAGYDMSGVPLAEAAYSFGSVPTCDFAVPGSGECKNTILPWIQNHDAMILDRHGAVTLGKNILQAVSKMEMLNSVAGIYLNAIQLGKVRYLDEKQVDRILQKARRMDVNPTALEAWKMFVLKNLHND